MPAMGRMHDGGEQHSIEHGVPETNTGALFLELQQAHVEGGIVGHQDRPLGETMEEVQHLADIRLPLQHFGLNSMNADRILANDALGFHQLFKNFRFEQPAVDDAHGAQGDHLVAFANVQPRGLGVENRIGQLRKQPVVQFGAWPG